MTTDAPNQLAAKAVNSVRSTLVLAAVLGIVLGILVMVWTTISVFLAGIFFGIALLVAGFYRLYFAFAAQIGSAAMRILLLVVGVLLVICGVIAILSPEDSWLMLAIFIGVGWIFSGFQSIFGVGIPGVTMGPRWLEIVGGVISVLAGIVMLIVSPIYTLTAIAWLAGLMLIVVSIVTLFSLPKKVEA
ncbi:MAG: DUF308 domain-containing protein [Gordonia sp. (in: high G+C Gram-positive bacteria)]